MANFINEWYCPDLSREAKKDEWKLYINGADNKRFKGTRIALKGSNGVTVEYALKLSFKVINNVAEYGMLMERLDLAKEMKSKKLNVYNDSPLIVR